MMVKLSGSSHTCASTYVVGIPSRASRVAKQYILNYCECYYTGLAFTRIHSPYIHENSVHA